MDKRWVLGCGAAFVLSTLLVACSGDGGGGEEPDAGLDAHDGVIVEPVVQVSGTASMFPNAVTYLSDAGLPVPDVAGLTLSIEEPLSAALKDPNAVFGSVVLPADGRFAVDGVDTSKVNVGLAGAIRDERDAGTPAVVPSATAVFDVQLAEGKPETDLAGAKAYALPAGYHDKLTELVTPGRIQALNATSSGVDSLIEAGFVLGKVVDAQGNPVAGAVIETDPAALAQTSLFYPDVALATLNQTATDADGLFLFVNSLDPENADKPITFTLTVKDRPEYLRRSAASWKDSALILTVFPGRTAP